MKEKEDMLIYYLNLIKNMDEEEFSKLTKEDIIEMLEIIKNQTDIKN